MRTLAIDLGQKRIGLAISDPLGITAQGLPSLYRQKHADGLDAIHTLCIEREVRLCLVGLPLRMNGEVGDQAKGVLAWTEKLRAHLAKLPCEVRTWDERLTSKEAGRLMIQEDLSRRKQKEKSDMIAATLILQNYLESIRTFDDPEA